MAPAIRVLHCINDLSPHGAQRMLVNLLQHRSLQVDPAVVTLRGNGEFEEELHQAGVPVYSCEWKASNPLGFLNRLRALMTKLRPQIVHGWLYHGSLAATLGALSRGSKVPVIWSIRRANASLRWDTLPTRAAVRMASWSSWHPRVIVHNTGEGVLRHLECGFSSRVPHLVLPNGFDTERFRPSDALRREMRSGLGLEDADIVIGIAGRFRPEKAYRDFVRAAAEVTNREPRARFVLAGEGTGVENEELTGWIREAGGDRLMRNCRRLGLERDMPRFYSGLDIFCSSSVSEGFPNVVGEAMSSGIPCAVTACGASSHIVGSTGMIAPAGDVDRIAEALLTLSLASARERQRMGELARARIEEHFSIRSVTGRYELLYQGLNRGWQ